MLVLKKKKKKKKRKRNSNYEETKKNTKFLHISYLETRKRIKLNKENSSFKNKRASDLIQND